MKNSYFVLVAILLLFCSYKANAQNYSKSYGTATAGEELKTVVRVGANYYTLGNSGNSLMLSAIDIVTGNVLYTQVYDGIPATAYAVLPYGTSPTNQLLLIACTPLNGGEASQYNSIYIARVNLSDGAIVPSTTINTVRFPTRTITSNIVGVYNITANTSVRRLAGVVESDNGNYILAVDINRYANNGTIADPNDNMLFCRYNPATNAIAWATIVDGVPNASTQVDDCHDFELTGLVSDGSGGAVFMGAAVGVVYPINGNWTNGTGNYPIVVGTVSATGTITTRHLSNNAIFSFSLQSNGLAGTARRYLISGTRSRATTMATSPDRCTFDVGTLPNAVILVELNSTLGTVIRRQTFQLPAGLQVGALGIASATAYYAGTSATVDSFLIGARFYGKGIVITREGFGVFKITSPIITTTPTTPNLFVPFTSSSPTAETVVASAKMITSQTLVNGVTTYLSINGSFYDRPERVVFTGSTSPNTSNTNSDALFAMAQVKTLESCILPESINLVSPATPEFYQSNHLVARTGTATNTTATITSTVTSPTVVSNNTCTCSNTSSTISATATAVCPSKTTTLSATGGTAYLWNNGTTTAANTVNPTATTTYTVTITNTASNCTVTATKTITVNTAPNLSIAGNSSICQGYTTGLSASSNPTWSYQWANSATPGVVYGTSSSILSATYVVGTTIYTVTATTPLALGGCTATASKSVTVLPRPNPVIDKASDIVCAGSTIALTATGGTSYVWSNGATTAVVNVGAGIYTVTATGSNGCPQIAVASVSSPTCNGVTPNAGVTATVTASTGATILPAIVETGVTHKWQLVKFSNNGVEVLVYPTATSPIPVGTSRSIDGYLVSTNFIVPIGTMVYGHQYLIKHIAFKPCCEVATNFCTFITPTSSAPTSGTRSVNPDNTGGASTNINESELKSSILVSPNPTAGDLNVQYTLVGEKTGETSLTVTDILGRQIIVNKLEEANGSMILNTNDWAAGFYQITIKNGENRPTKKVSVVKQ